MLKNKVFAVSVLIFALTHLLCSCSGYTEIENMDILTSHFVAKDGDGVRIGGGVANVRSLNDSMADSPVSYISASGQTLSDARKNLILSANHQLFYGSLRVLIIEDDYAKEGIGEFLDYILSNSEHRTSVTLVTSSSNPRDIVEYRAINDFTGGFAAEGIIRTLQAQRLMSGCALSDVCEARANEQVGFVLPDILVEEGIMSIRGYSVFDRDKKIATLGSEHTAALNYLLSKNAIGEYTLYLQDGNYFSCKAEMIKREIDADENDDGTLCARVSLEFDIKLSAPMNVQISQEDKAMVQNMLEEKIKAEIEALMRLAVSERCDFLRLYKSYQTKHRRRFYETDWREKMGNAQLDIDIKCCAATNNFGR